MRRKGGHENKKKKGVEMQMDSVSYVRKEGKGKKEVKMIWKGKEKNDGEAQGIERRCNDTGKGEV